MFNIEKKATIWKFTAILKLHSVCIRLKNILSKCPHGCMNCMLPMCLPAPHLFCDAWLSCVMLLQSAGDLAPQLSPCARPCFPAFCLYQDASVYSSWNYWALGLHQLRCIEGSCKCEMILGNGYSHNFEDKFVNSFLTYYDKQMLWSYCFPVSANLLYFKAVLIICRENSGLQENGTQEPSVKILMITCLTSYFTVCLSVISVVTDSYLCVFRDGSQEKSAPGLEKWII